MTSGLSPADLLESLSADVTALVRQEFQRAQQELAGKARQARTAVGMLGAAGALGALAAGSSVTLLRRVLERRLPPVASAVVTTALLGGGAAALTATARERLRAVRPLVSGGAVAELLDEVRAAAAAMGAPPA